MKILFLGDSITAGAWLVSPALGFPALVGEKLHCEIKNYGVGGTRIARQRIPSEERSYDEDFLQRAEKMDKTADFVFVFGGTNDFGHGDAPIGNTDDVTPYTFCGALNCLTEYLRGVYGKDKVVFILPLHRTDEDNKRGENSCKQNEAGSLNDYIQAEIEVLTKQQTEFLDLRKKFPLSELNTLTVDGLHPTADGHAIIAEAIEAYVNKRRVHVFRG
ncbi:MAG: SGNH/GDSL hydrolase family protein [Candidatus Scatosoma sp.]